MNREKPASDNSFRVKNAIRVTVIEIGLVIFLRLSSGSRGKERDVGLLWVYDMRVCRCGPGGRWWQAGSPLPGP